MAMDTKTSESQLLTFDFIIVGQGIAGTLLAYFLLKAGKKVLVIDNQHESSASKAAAGIINPITGRKFVKSWRVDDLIPCAKQTYHELETLLNIEIFHSRGVIRTMSTAGEENDWMARTAELSYAPYVSEQIDLGTYAEKTNRAFGYGEVLQGGQVNLPLLIEHFRKYLQQKSCIVDEVFDMKQMKILPESVRYKEFISTKIIFCEGAKANQNPYFNYLPFHGDKGEALIVRIPNADFEKILKQQIFVVPLSKNDLYWIGSTYERHYSHDKPSEKGYKYLYDHLQKLLKVPFEIIEHLAAVRPTVRDRRPFLGLHPKFPQLGIFNGLGTKGASLGPFWAKHFVDFLLENISLEKEVDINRFS